MDSEQNKINCRKYHEAHKEEARIKAKEYRETHKKEISAWHKADWQKNREKYLVKKKEYYQKNKNRIVEKRLKNHQINKDRDNQYSKKYNKELRQRVRSILLWYLGYRCAKCGYWEDSRLLHLDHKLGGGSQEQKQFRGSEMYRYYAKHPELVFERFQLLCSNCNWLKRYENNECQPKPL